MNEPSSTIDPLARVRRTELMISGLLRSGVLLSVALVLFGTLLTLIHHPDYLTNSTRLDELRQGTAGYPASVGGVFRGVLAFQGRSFVMLGLLVLIATPVARVAVSTLAFLQLGDRVFAIITTCVLSLLVVALVLGKAGG